MRKLTSLGCLLAAYCFFFLGCQKSQDFNDRMSSIPPSVSSQVFEANTESFDFQHVVTKKNFIEPVQPAPTLNHSARFVITYFDLFEGEKERIYTFFSLNTALQEAGVSEKETKRRLDRIFNSTHCSPSYLAETARLLSPTLPPHTEGVFISELFMPDDIASIETFAERKESNPAFLSPYRKTVFGERVKGVNKLVGVSGSIAAFGDSQIELHLMESDTEESTTYRIHYQAVRAILQQKYGYTEGEALYLKLILGELTEHEVWLLFETGICPEWRKANAIHTNSVLSRLVFRYNYVEIVGSTGRLGYTIYDLDGFTD
ncbi:MAG: hypothetical protein JNL70_20420 [Saprospiraceae bacterium]|nr:hypothetical protein [Saprospiraceae bacterium]